MPQWRKERKNIVKAEKVLQSKLLKNYKIEKEKLLKSKLQIVGIDKKQILIKQCEI